MERLKSLLNKYMKSTSGLSEDYQIVSGYFGAVPVT